MRARLALLACAFLLPGSLRAHPMGNFSVNRWTSITLHPGGAELVHVLDLAEIPTQMELSGMDGPPEGERLESLKTALARRLVPGLTLEVDGRPSPLSLVRASLGFLPGAGGLPTARLELRLRAGVPRGSTNLAVTFRDANFEGRLGWKEVTARAEGGVELLSSDVPEKDRSRGLTEYPADPLVAPADTTEAHLRVKTPEALAPAPAIPDVAERPAGGAPSSARVEGPRVRPIPAAPPPPQTASKREDALTRLIHARELGPGLVAFALLVAFGLGSLHALSPGHGKTVVAAYLVGSRGTALHALILGLVVTASHTAGVFALGFVTLSLSKSVVPERLFPMIELVSGLSIAAVGTAMLVRRLRRPARDDEHGGPLGHTHAESLPEGTPTLPALLVLGASGGVLPCPSALVVLLSAIALGRIAFGLLLIVAFSLGLATVLSAVGIAVVHAGRLLAKSEAFGVWAFRVPVVSAFLVAALGFAISAKALHDVGLFFVRL